MEWKQRFFRVEETLEVSFLLQSYIEKVITDHFGFFKYIYVKNCVFFFFKKKKKKKKKKHYVCKSQAELCIDTVLSVTMLGTHGAPGVYN